MAEKIPDLEVDLDRGAQEVIDAAGFRDTGEKLIGAVSSLFNFAPKLYHSIKVWARSVQESEKRVYEALGALDNRSKEQGAGIDDIKKVVDKCYIETRNDIDSIKKVVDQGD